MISTTNTRRTKVNKPTARKGTLGQKVEWVMNKFPVARTSPDATVALIYSSFYGASYEKGRLVVAVNRKGTPSFESIIRTRRTVLNSMTW